MYVGTSLLTLSFCEYWRRGKLYTNCWPQALLHLSSRYWVVASAVRSLSKHIKVNACNIGVESHSLVKISVNNRIRFLEYYDRAVARQRSKTLHTRDMKVLEICIKFHIFIYPQEWLSSWWWARYLKCVGRSPGAKFYPWPAPASCYSDFNSISRAWLIHNGNHSIMHGSIRLDG